MNVFCRFTRKSLLRNRSRTIVTVIGIMLSMALFTAVIEGAYSGIQFLLRSEESRVGSFHAYYYDVDESDFNKIMKADGIDKTTYWQDVGWAEIGSKNEYKPYLLIESMQPDFTDMVKVDIVNGRLPENENEITLPVHLRSNGGVSYLIGDEITLDVGKRMSDGYELNRFAEFISKVDENIEGTSQKTYKVVGFYSRFDTLIESYSCPAYIALTRGPADGDSSVFFTVDRPSSFFSYMEKNQINNNWVNHSDLLMFCGSINNSSIMSVLYSFAAILVLLISFGSISLIYNSFSISVSERTKQFGILKSVGATRKQIRGTVLYEALLLCVTAIPLGLIVGCAGIGITLWCLRDSFSSIVAMADAETVKMYLVISPLGLAIASLVCVLTTLISAWLPARKAIRISPIDAIRQSRDVKIKRSDVKTFAATKKLFGFEGMLASKNFGRNKKRYRSTVVSLFMSIVLFISASSFCAYLTDNVSDLSSASGYTGVDIYYYTDDEDNAVADNIFSMLKNVEGIKKSAYYRNRYTTLFISEEYISDSFKNSDFFKNSGGLKDGICSINGNIIFIDDDTFKELCKENNIDPEGYFDEELPKSLVYNKITKWNNEGKLINTAVFKNDAKSIKSSSISLKQLEGYVCADVDNIGGEKTYYYTKEQLEQFDSEEDDGKELDRSIGVKLTAEEAEIVTELEGGAFIKATPFGISSTESSLVMIYPLSAESKFISDMSFSNSQATTKFNFSCDDHRQVYEKMKNTLEENGYVTGFLHDSAADSEAIRTLVLIVNVFSYGFIILISAIAMANVFNTVSTNIALRRREFAMLKTVGMTNRSFSRMMNYECLIYGAKGLVWGLPAAFGMTYLIYRASIAANDVAFYIPWYSVAIAVGSVFAVVFATMLYATSKINKDNPIDALKNENL